MSFPTSSGVPEVPSVPPAPSVTNLLAGDGAGGFEDSGIDPATVGPVSDPNVAYLRTDGSDTTGTGTINKPWRNAQKAYNEGVYTMDLGTGSDAAGAADFGTLTVASGKTIQLRGRGVDYATLTVVVAGGAGPETKITGNGVRLLALQASFGSTSETVSARLDGLTVESVAFTGATGAPGTTPTQPAPAVGNMTGDTGGTGGTGATGGTGGSLAATNCTFGNVTLDGGTGGQGGQGGTGGQGGNAAPESSGDGAAGGAGGTGGTGGAGGTGGTFTLTRCVVSGTLRSADGTVGAAGVGGFGGPGGSGDGPGSVGSAGGAGADGSAGASGSAGTGTRTLCIFTNSVSSGVTTIASVEAGVFIAS